MRISFGARHDFLRHYGIPESWKPCTLGQLARVVGGGTPSRDERRFWEGTIPWVTPTDLTANQGKRIRKTAECITEAGLLSSAAELLPTGSVLYTSRATIGAKAIAALPIATNQGFASFLPCSVNGDYLYYLLDLLTPTIKRLGAGTTFDEVSKRDIRTVWCAIPLDVEEQAAIARIFDAMDTALERTCAAAERARELRKSLLVDLLSRGIGVDGKVRQFKIQRNEFEFTPLGRLPADWRVSAVGVEFDLQNGFTLNANRRARFKRRPYLRVANVQRDALDLSDVQELEADDSEFALRLLQVDDLLVVEGHADRMQIGRCARVTPEASGMTFQNHLFRLRTKGAVLPPFATLWLNSAYAQRFWNARCATSSGLNTINQRTLKRLMIPVPPNSEQQAIIELAEHQRRHVDALVGRQAQLEMLKTSLLHDLLTGRVRLLGTSKAAA